MVVPDDPLRRRPRPVKADLPTGAKRMAQGPSIALIVPTLNEELSLSRHFREVFESADEAIVSDGGSGDRTRAVARSLGARVVTGPPGRGGQLNRGAAAAASEVLLFLHADTLLPAGGLEAVREAMRSDAVGGGFKIRFDVDSPVYRFGAGVVNRRTSRAKVPLGDQAQFARSSVFREMGGFADWPVLEDLDFIRRLGKRGRLAIVPLTVTTSSRRFEELGPLRTVVLNWLIWLLYAGGVSPNRLARLYRNVR